MGIGLFTAVRAGEVSMGSLPLLSGGGHNLAVGQQGWPSGKNPDVRQDRARQTRPERTKQNPQRQTGNCVAGPSPAGPGLPTEEAGPLLTELHLDLVRSSEELWELWAQPLPHAEKEAGTSAATDRCCGSICTFAPSLGFEDAASLPPFKSGTSSPAATLHLEPYREGILGNSAPA